jgi:hypothetical protein
MFKAFFWRSFDATLDFKMRQFFYFTGLAEPFLLCLLEKIPYLIVKVRYNVSKKNFELPGIVSLNFYVVLTKCVPGGEFLFIFSIFIIILIHR